MAEEIEFETILDAIQFLFDLPAPLWELRDKSIEACSGWVDSKRMIEEFEANLKFYTSVDMGSFEVISVPCKE